MGVLGCVCGHGRGRLADGAADALIAVAFIVFFGAAGLYAIPSMQVGLFYLLVLIAQYVVVRHAAATYGVRMVTTVLARRAAKETPEAPKAPRKRRRSKAGWWSVAVLVPRPRRSRTERATWPSNRAAAPGLTDRRKSSRSAGWRPQKR